MVDPDQNDILFGDESISKKRQCAGALGKAAPMYIDHDRALSLQGWRQDVQYQAVLTVGFDRNFGSILSPSAEIRTQHWRGIYVWTASKTFVGKLHLTRSGLYGVTNTSPRGRLGGRHESASAFGRAAVCN